MRSSRTRAVLTLAGALIVGAAASAAARSGQLPSAQSLLNAAEKTAAATHKNIWVMFDASW